MSSKTKKIIATEVKRQSGKAAHHALRMGKAAYDTIEMPKRPIDRLMSDDSTKMKAKAKAKRKKAPMDYMAPQNAAEQKIVDRYNAEIEAIGKKHRK